MKLKRILNNFKNHTPWKIKKLAFSIKGACTSVGIISFVEKHHYVAMTIMVIGFLCDIALNFYAEEEDDRIPKKL